MQLTPSNGSALKPSFTPPTPKNSRPGLALPLPISSPSNPSTVNFFSHASQIDRLNAVGSDSNAVEVTPKIMNKFARFLMSVDILLFIFAGLCCHFQNATQGASQFALLCLYICLLTWVTTLSSECSRVPLMVTSSLVLGVIMLGPYPSTWGWRTFVADNIVGFIIPQIIVNCIFTTLLYKMLSLVKKCLQLKYKSHNMIAVSVEMLIHFASVMPIVYYFAVYQAAGYAEVLYHNDRYAAYTPFCSYEPDMPSGVGNTLYKCPGAQAASDKECLDGNFILGHMKFGLVELETFHSPNEPYGWEEAKEYARNISDVPVLTNRTNYLMYHDYMRFRAEEQHTDGYREATIALLQGTAFIISLLVGEIFLRITDTKLSDLLEFNVSVLEATAVFCTVLQGALAVGIGSLKGDAFASGVWVIGMVFGLCVMFQFVCLYLLCGRILKQAKQGGEYKSGGGKIAPEGPAKVTIETLEEKVERLVQQKVNEAIKKLKQQQF
ncbi:hypothetical protein TrLO_g12870 [Triparma laevis f. longispina]|uniref:Uncharacterized protein n=1 Tax=Triparma laevis f. longispina TaxID=1714387 RepID=A0A9W7KZ74_9STRA|nr:hypothetical protein TrLO_g12870 [Triparma laevis f. longispina]